MREIRERRQFGRYWYGWEDSIKIDTKEWGSVWTTHM
jgi:hypothetical protein